MQQENKQPESNENQPLDGRVSLTKKTSTPSATEGIIPSKVAVDLEGTQIAKFATKGGTGFAAEDANAFIDERNGHTVERVGENNAKNGADRIVDGISIQTKYFDTASRTVGAAFDDKTGLFRYEDMPIEVPRDQAEEAIKIMAKRIEEGRVPGYTDPQDAPKLIRPGNVTYRQARNIARAGNLDSLKYDARNGAVTCTAAFGLSFIVEYGSSLWRGESSISALKNATLRGIQTAGVAFFTSVGSAQLLRTQAARTGTVMAKDLLKGVYKTEVGRDAIHKIAQVSLGKAVFGAPALNHVSRLLRSNVITGAVTLTVLTLPDIYKATITGSKSWAQVGKNLVVGASGLAAAGAGATSGAVAGASLGSVIPGVGTAIGGAIGGVLGGLGVGVAGGIAAKQVMDLVVDDDSVPMQKLLDDELQSIAFDHLFTQAEFDKYLKFIGDCIPSGFLGDLHASASRSQFIRDQYEVYAMELIKARQPVLPPNEQQVLDYAAELLDQAAAEEAGDISTAQSQAAPTPGASAEDVKPETYTPNFTMPGAGPSASAIIDSVVGMKAGQPGFVGKILSKIL